jgi:hypothetical protein
MSPHRPWLEPAGVTALFAALGLCAYGIARLCAGRFYGPLGVRPEDLGIGYPGLVERSLGPLAFVALCVLVIVLMVMAVVIMLGPLVAMGAAWLRQWPRVFIAACCIGLAALVSAWLLFSTEGRITLLLVIVGTLAFLVYPKIGSVRVAMSVFALLAVGVLVVFGYVMGGQASIDADRAMRGVSADGKLFGLPAAPWRSDVAYLQWRGEVPRGFQKSLCGLVLGGAGSSTTVYTSDLDGVRRTLTIDRGDALLQILPDATQCKWRSETSRAARLRRQKLTSVSDGRTRNE